MQIHDSNWSRRRNPTVIRCKNMPLYEELGPLATEGRLRRPTKANRIEIGPFLRRKIRV